MLAANKSIGRSARIENTLFGLGLALVIAGFVFVQEASFMPLSAGISVIGTGLLLVSGQDNALSRITISTRPFVAVGLVSYPLYLWHWPILVFARALNDQIAPLVTCMLMGLAVALAAITYLCLELPLHGIKAAKFTPALLCTLVALGVFGAMNSRVDMRTLFYPEKIREILAFSKYDFRSDARIGRCWLYDRSQNYSDDCALKGNASLPKIAVWGDSHAGRFFPGLAIAAEGKADVTGYAADACPPIQEFGSCQTFLNGALSAFVKNKPDIVVLFARWPRYSGDYSSGSSMAAGLIDTIDALERVGIKVAIVGPFPTYAENLPDLVYKQWLADKSKGIPKSISNMPSPDVATVDAELRSLAEQRHLDYLSLINMFCSDRACATTWSDDPADLLSWDYGHLTTKAGSFIGGKLLDRLTH